MNATLMFAALALGAPALKDPPKKEATIVGEWAVESVNVGATPSSPSSNHWEFNADGTFSIHSDGKTVTRSNFVCDSKVTPCTLDILPSGAGSTQHLCRFQIDGDKLILSVGHDSNVRPSNLEPAEKTTVWVMKRVKK
jgi:hypothetical protein